MGYLEQRESTPEHRACSLDVAPGMRWQRDVKTGDSEAGGTFGFKTLGHRDSTQAMSHP